MTTDFRALCKELTDALAEWELGGSPPEDTADADLVARARAALAAEPEPPDAGAVADDRPCTCHPDDNPPRPCPKRYALNECKDFAEREVAELVAALREPGDPFPEYRTITEDQADRAADLLEHLAPQPVPE